MLNLIPKHIIEIIIENIFIKHFIMKLFLYQITLRINFYCKNINN